MTTKNPPSLVDYLLLGGLSAMLGASFMFTSVALQDFTPLTVVTFRITGAMVLLLVLMLMCGQRLPRGRIWWVILACAFLGNALPFMLIAWAQVKVDAGVTAIFMALMPLATIFLAHFFTPDEKMNRLKIVGVLLGLLGVIVLIGVDSLRAIGNETARQVAIVGSTFCYAINAILTRKLTHLPKRSMIAALLLAASVMMLPIWFVLEQPWEIDFMDTQVRQGLFSMMVLAVGPTALATLMILVIIGRQGASYLSQINFMLPLFGVFFGAVFLRERLPVNGWLALVIIIAGIAITRYGSRNGKTIMSSA